MVIRRVVSLFVLSQCVALAGCVPPPLLSTDGGELLPDGGIAVQKDSGTPEQTDPCHGVSCGGHGVCNVSGTSAYCMCIGGYKSVGTACVPDEDYDGGIDPPMTDGGSDPCANVTCSGQGTCKAVNGSPTCECKTGYMPSGTSCLPNAQATFVAAFGFGDDTRTDVTMGSKVFKKTTDSNAQIRFTADNLTKWPTTFGGGDLVPATDDSTAAVLNHHFAAKLGSLKIEVGVSNGTYQVTTYHMENYQSHFRSYDIAVQGTKKTSEPVDLELQHWTKQGPYEAVVTNGILTVELQQLTGDASIMAMELSTTTGGMVKDLP